MYVRLHTCMYVDIHVCMYTCKHTCHVYVNIHVYVYPLALVTTFITCLNWTGIIAAKGKY